MPSTHSSRVHSKIFMARFLRMVAKQRFGHRTAADVPETDEQHAVTTAHEDSDPEAVILFLLEMPMRIPTRAVTK